MGRRNKIKLKFTKRVSWDLSPQPCSSKSMVIKKEKPCSSESMMTDKEKPCSSKSVMINIARPMKNKTKIPLGVKIKQRTSSVSEGDSDDDRLDFDGKREKKDKNKSTPTPNPSSDSDDYTDYDSDDVAEYYQPTTTKSLRNFKDAGNRYVSVESGDTDEIKRGKLICHINVKMTTLYENRQMKLGMQVYQNARLKCEEDVDVDKSKQAVWKKIPESWWDKITDPKANSGRVSSKIVSTITFPNGTKKVKEIRAVQMNHVASNPPMTHWTETSVNYRSDDGKFLVNYPYLGENVQDEEFENELYKSYGSVDHKSLKKHEMPDEVFYNTINEVEKVWLNEVEGGGDTMTDGEDLSRQRTNSGVVIPCRLVFKEMAKAFPFLGFPFELEKRYAKLLSEGKMATLNGGVMVKKNVPVLPTQVMESEAGMDKKFCRRCLIYCCVTHDVDDDVEQKFITNNRPEDPKILENFKCYHKDCIKRTGISTNVRNKNTLAKWTTDEMNLCQTLMEDAKDNYCIISSIMTSKSCREVYNFCKSENAAVLTSECAKSPVKKSRPLQPQMKELKKNKNGPEKEGIKTTKSGQVKFLPKNWSTGEDCPRYVPCQHADGGYCNDSNICSCFDRGSYCDKYCSCPLDCVRRFKGCKCKTDCSDTRCPCYATNHECSPSLCRSCGSENPIPVKGKCKNVALLYQREKQIDVKKSKVAGWGTFATSDIKRYQLIGEYRGELISTEESHRRALYYDKIQHTYLFSLNEDITIDATRIGSKVRFMNSSKNPNCVPKLMVVNGDNRIGIYANKFIKAGSELFFDYQEVIHQTMDEKNNTKAVESKVPEKSKLTGSGKSSEKSEVAGKSAGKKKRA